MCSCGKLADIIEAEGLEKAKFKFVSIFKIPKQSQHNIAVKLIKKEK